MIAFLISRIHALLPANAVGHLGIIIRNPDISNVAHTSGLLMEKLDFQHQSSRWPRPGIHLFWGASGILLCYHCPPHSSRVLCMRMYLSTLPIGGKWWILVIFYTPKHLLKNEWGDCGARLHMGISVAPPREEPQGIVNGYLHWEERCRWAVWHYSFLLKY